MMKITFAYFALERGSFFLFIRHARIPYRTFGSPRQKILDGERRGMMFQRSTVSLFIVGDNGKNCRYLLYYYYDAQNTMK